MQTTIFNIMNAKNDTEEVCANCIHFHQHYIKEDRAMLAINCGHCTCLRIKHSKPYSTCKEFKNRKED